MNVELMLGIQIVADVILCIAIVCLLIIVTKEIKKRTSGVDQAALDEFKSLIEESRRSADYLLQTLDEGRRSFKEVAYALDEKEKRIKLVTEDSPGNPPKMSSYDSKTNNNDGHWKKYEQVITMVERGFEPKDIARELNVTEGEVNLIVGLNRKKNENI
jgi:DNA-binding NarL/FixJ family response regulator